MMNQEAILAKLNTIESLLLEQTTKPLTLEEAAIYLDISRSHLYKLTSKSEIPHYKPQGKRVYFSKPELDKWLLRNPIKTNEEIEQQATNHVTLGKKRG